MSYVYQPMARQELLTTRAMTMEGREVFAAA
jgi:hypothetical protein